MVLQVKMRFKVLFLTPVSGRLTLFQFLSNIVHALRYDVIRGYSCYSFNKFPIDVSIENAGPPSESVTNQHHLIRVILLAS
jgi:hypothetical protein